MHAASCPVSRGSPSHGSARHGSRRLRRARRRRRRRLGGGRHPPGPAPSARPPGAPAPSLADSAPVRGPRPGIAGLAARGPRPELNDADGRGSSLLLWRRCSAVVRSAASALTSRRQDSGLVRVRACTSRIDLTRINECDQRLGSMNRISVAPLSAQCQDSGSSVPAGKSGKRSHAMVQTNPRQSPPRLAQKRGILCSMEKGGGERCLPPLALSSESERARVGPVGSTRVGSTTRIND